MTMGNDRQWGMINNGNWLLGMIDNRGIIDNEDRQWGMIDNGE